VITFDTGVLFALERRDKRMWDRFRRLRERGVPILVPASCESEWWRGAENHAAVRLAILPSVVPLTDAIACAAGEALATVERPRRRKSPGLTVDAQVMATASLRGGGAVLTTDPADLALFAGHFPSVTIEPL
jgi:predicted nucleic acid-binding protein